MIFWICVLATASDLWFAFQFVGPLILTHLFVVKKNRWKFFVKTWGIPVLLGTSVGYFLPPAIEALGWFHLPQAAIAPEFIDLPKWWDGFLNQLDHVTSNLREQFKANPAYSLVPSLVTVAGLWNLWKLKARLTLFGALSVFLFFQVILVVFFISALEMWHGPGNFRYLLPTAIIGLAAGILFFTSFLSNKNWLNYFFICAALVGLGGFFLPSLSYPPQLVRNEYRSWEQCFDQAVQEENLTSGLSEYWMAKYMSLLSHSKVRVNQVTPRFELEYWINNMEWYKDQNTGKLRPYDFFVAQKHDEMHEFIPKRFGPPSKTINCEIFDIYVYKGTSGEAFNQVFKSSFEHFFNKNRPRHGSKN